MSIFQEGILRISGIVKCIERSPYEAFINFKSTGLNNVSCLTVKGTELGLLRDLNAGDKYSANCVLWLAKVIQSYATPMKTFIEQPSGENGTIVRGRVLAVVDSDTLILEIDGIADTLKVELEECGNFCVGKYLELKGELHVEI